MASTRDVAAHRFQRTNQLANTDSIVFPHPRGGLLPFAKAPDIRYSLPQTFAQLRRQELRGRFDLLPGYADRLGCFESVPACRIAAQRAVAVATYVTNDAAHQRLQRGGLRAACGEALHGLLGGASREQAHHSTTLFNGYSTMPCACASLSRGTTSHAADSSITVFTASQLSSLKVEMVGFFNAGRTARTPARCSFLTLSIRPTLSCASMAPRSMRARLSILRRLPASAQEDLLAITCVLDSSTVSRIRRRFALSELPVSVTSTIASANIGGLTSVAPQENSTRTSTPFFEK